ncbi:MAG: hypothetical protein KDC35_05780 [Acidobacteria bacterium]|nr:hypothetical protein [Acidobacteriota bacterium]
MNKRGFSLVITLGVIVILGMLALVSLAVVLADISLSGSLYSQGITLNAAESGVHQASPLLLDDADTNFTNVLNDNGGEVLVGTLAYPMIASGIVNFNVIVRDNNDLDGDFNTDTDGRIIVSSVGSLPSGGRTEVEVLLKYLGTETEYAQESGGSKSNSAFSSEVDIDSGLNQVMDGG